MANIGAIRTLLEAGVFHAIPTGGKSISATEISVKTGVEKGVIGRVQKGPPCENKLTGQQCDLCAR